MTVDPVFLLFSIFIRSCRYSGAFYVEIEDSGTDLIVSPLLYREPV